MNNPYPAYKPSGLPWLGDVPEHWEVRRLKAFRKMDAYGNAEGGALAYREGTVTLRKTRTRRWHGFVDRGVD